MAAATLNRRASRAAAELETKATELRRMAATAREPGVMELLLRLAGRFDRAAATARRTAEAEGQSVSSS
jgi:hypothetical protein